MKRSEKNYLKERAKYNWFVLNIKTHLIETGYEYKGDAKEFIDELKSYASPEDYQDLKVYSKKFLTSIGIDTDRPFNWKGHAAQVAINFRDEDGEEYHYKVSLPLTVNKFNYFDGTMIDPSRVISISAI